MSNTWVTCLSEGDNSGKLELRPHELLGAILRGNVERQLKEGPASD